MHRIVAHELADILWQVLGAGHGGVVDKHRNDAQAGGERGAHFQADEVAIEIDAALTLRRCGAQPVRADDGDERAGCVDGAFDLADEVFAGCDAVDINEDAVTADARGDRIGDAAGYVRGVVAPVADKDSPGQSRSSPDGALCAGGGAKANVGWRCGYPAK